MVKEHTWIRLEVVPGGLVRGRCLPLALVDAAAAAAASRGASAKTVAGNLRYWRLLSSRSTVTPKPTVLCARCEARKPLIRGEPE